MKEQTYRIESKINRILFWISVFITIVTMVMMAIEFFSRGAFPTTRIGNFYIGVLLIYSFHKEALRWLEEKDTRKGQRRGEIFVYSWFILTTILYLVNFLRHDYYMTDPSGKETKALMEITVTALESGAVFIFTRLIKIIFNINYNKK
ncbi:MAG: hypothetical protein PHV47_01535 [Candidatus Pacebacteria bacterium]|nr:hypothetical protein [Candidatus Paceibacterota bacterium]